RQRGEAAVDDVEVVPQGGSNRVANGSFSSGASGWTFQGTHRTSAVEAQAGASGAGLQIRAVKRGDATVNRIRTPLTSPLTNGSTATIRAQARWMAGHPELLLRLRGNHLEAVGALTVPRNLGTPGAPNSRLRALAPPAIDQALHRPVLPAPAEAVRVTARVSSPVPANVTLQYRIDPSLTLTELPMRDDGTGADLVAGDGIHSAFIPGQASGVLAAFRVRASADAPPPATTSVYPPDGTSGAVEGLVRWGEPSYPGDFGTYRIRLTRARLTEWTNREKLSNEPIPVTFVYGDSRVIYEAGAYYRGSAYTSPGYNSPTGTICGYDVVFPDDDRFLGENGITLDFPVRDPTAQREQLMFWFCDQFGLPNNHRRYVNVFINGIGQRQRGGWGPNANAIYEDVQGPGADTIREWFDGQEDGALFKGDYWHEFDDAGNRIDPATANTLEEFLSSTGGKKKARYRWTWRPRAVGRSADDFEPLFRLVDAFNVPNDSFTAAVDATVDVDQWMRTFVANDLASNWDSFGNPGGKNTYHYLPPEGRWQLMSWDFDVGIGVFNNPVNAALFSVSDPRVQRLYSNPTFMRSYWRALDEAVSTFFQPSSVSPLLNAKYAALQASGVPVTSPNVASGESGLSIPAWITQRRTFLLGQLANVNAAFAITTNNGNGFVTGDTVTTIRGTAPVEVAGLLLDGTPVPARWLNTTSWEILAPIGAGANTLMVEGADSDQQPIPGLVDSIVVTGTTTPESPTGRIVISEIMYHPPADGAEFVEIANLSATTAFDIGGWRLNGTGLVFPSGTIIPPAGFIVAADSRQAFGRAHGWGIPVAAEFPGALDNGGETLTLFQPPIGGGPEVVVDLVRYDDDAPWPTAADGLGASLQLVDASRDNRRLGNWAAAAPDQGPPPVLLPLDAEWRYLQSGFAPAGWTVPEYDDSAWPAGRALLYVESAALPGPKNTLLSLGPITYYFRARFDYGGSLVSPSLDLTTVLDDGAVIYLNGQELHR
ncbi:MAG TPA: CotH kinase family protein, partial [Longimicrobiaceae bacterium]|nr:CotH kinase family protein [Longimicrobiaceae bacterium]